MNEDVLPTCRDFLSKHVSLPEGILSFQKQILYCYILGTCFFCHLIPELHEKKFQNLNCFHRVLLKEKVFPRGPHLANLFSIVPSTGRAPVGYSTSRRERCSSLKVEDRAVLPGL